MFCFLQFRFVFLCNVRCLKLNLRKISLKENVFKRESKTLIKGLKDFLDCCSAVHAGLSNPTNPTSLKGLTKILKSFNQVNQGSDSVQNVRTLIQGLKDFLDCCSAVHAGLLHPTNSTSLKGLTKIMKIL